jgi:glycosyltransferase involved in cell wall biosynthesis
MCAAARADMGYLIVPFVAPVMAHRNQTLKDALAEISCVITPSEFVKSMFGWQGYKTANWQVVPLGLDGQPMPRPAYAGPPRFAFIGGLAHQKGAHVLIEAFNAMPPDWALTIAGDEDAFPEYTHGLWTQAEHEGITFTGKLSRAEVWRLLSETDVVVVPSLWHETASLIAREAVAAGCVLVASDMGALREAPQGSRKNFYFPVGDVAALAKTLREAAAEAGKPAALGPYRKIAQGFKNSRLAFVS